MIDPQIVPLVREPEQPPTVVIIPPAAQDQAPVPDSAYTRHSDEASAAAGLLGLQAGVMVLRDLVIETVERSPEEEEEERRKSARGAGEGTSPTS